MLDGRGKGRHGIRFIERHDSIRDARPGSTVRSSCRMARALSESPGSSGVFRLAANPTLYSAPLLSPPSNNSGASVAVYGRRPS